MDATETLKYCPICSQLHHVCRHFEDMRWENLRLELELLWQHLKTWLAMMTATPALAGSPPSLRHRVTPGGSNPGNQMELDCFVGINASSQRHEPSLHPFIQVIMILLKTMQCVYDCISTGLGIVVWGGLSAGMLTRSLHGRTRSVPTNDHAQGQMQQTASLRERTRSVPQSEHSQGQEHMGDDEIPTAIPAPQLIPVATPLPEQDVIPVATPIADNTPLPEPIPVARPVIEAEALPVCSITLEVPNDPAQVHPCQHIFSFEAIQQWTDQHDDMGPCPNCRTPIQRITPLSVQPAPRASTRPPSQNPAYVAPRPPSRNPSYQSVSGVSMFSAPQAPQPSAPFIDLVDAPAATL